MLCFFTLSGISTNHTYFERYQDAWDVMATIKDTPIEDFTHEDEIHTLNNTDSVIYQKAEAYSSVPMAAISEEVESLGGLEALAGTSVSVAADIYRAALEEHDVKPVDRPELEVEQIEKGKELKFTVEVFVRPDVELGEYKHLGIEKKVEEVTDDDVMADIERARDRAARYIEVTDREAKLDDQANIDYQGLLDGTPFEGGTAQGHELVLGSAVAAANAPEGAAVAGVCGGYGDLFCARRHFSVHGDFHFPAADHRSVAAVRPHRGLLRACARACGTARRA